MASPLETRKSGDRLLKYLDDGRVCTSSELARLLVQEGVSEANARQIISRHSNAESVWRSKKLRLARDERLFAAANTVGMPDFFAKIGEKLQQSKRHGMARCVSALGFHQLLHRVNVIRLLAVSIAAENADGVRLERLYENELEGLRELGARIIQSDTAFESLAAPGEFAPGELDALAHQQADELRYEAMLTRILSERLRRQNMLSWNKIDLPDSSRPYTIFNGQVFSAFGFSYLSPLVRWREGSDKPTSCPVLIDCYHGFCTVSQVQSFIQRLERATIRGKKKQPCLGIIAARDFGREAWMIARENGLMTVSFRQMFGDDALEAMVQVEKLLNGLGHGTTAEGREHFEQMAKLIEDLKMNPVIVDLRSIGFEALCALILRERGYQNVEMERIVPWGETSRDIDVFGIRNGELFIIECKAYHRRKSLTGGEVRKFFTETVPAMKKWMRDTQRDFKTCTAEIWTTGPKGKDATTSLYELKPPRGDDWKLRRMEEMYDELPTSIRSRSIRLLESIALTVTDETENSHTVVQD